MVRWFFYLPFAYFLRTRVVTWSARISWCMIYFVPLLLILFSFSPDLGLASIGQLFLATVCTYTFYELGYMENDTVTIRNEDDPTLRLDELQQMYVSDYGLMILVVRLSLACILLSFLYSEQGFFLYCISLVCLALVFPIYNRHRGVTNAWLHPLLVTARFCGPLLLLLPESTVFLYGVLVFPLVNGLERARESRYGLHFMQAVWFSNGHSGRWGYYLAALLVWVAVCWVYDLAVLTLLPLFYMFLYRLVSPWLLKHFRVKQ